MESKQNRYILIGLTIICVVLIVVTSITDSWLAPLRTGVGVRTYSHPVRCQPGWLRHL
ncbi:hypothetical protein HMPREF9473_02610 [ [Hungatella hathewayi WAL-18680]|uniref:Uncharacterized protein n=1 Tax=Hungatella hathewayi WAL-18680 TaxID=742737 RepID=G5IGI2_9FIRM|nr:hypothetical protein HMPREF9473_02610 [ [Hungatella hathewayi WAL-18680]